MQRTVRMKRELKMFEESPPCGISCWSKDDSLQHLEAQIVGGDTTPYHGGVFKLDIVVPERYPFEPPNIQFVTPIYHPNIDTAGRICLDSLKMPPKGSWKPVLNITTLLTTIQLLLAEPNPDDPLMADIASEFKYNRPLFEDKARQWTKQHAMEDKMAATVMDKMAVAVPDARNASSAATLASNDTATAKMAATATAKMAATATSCATKMADHAGSVDQEVSRKRTQNSEPLSEYNKIKKI